MMKSLCAAIASGVLAVTLATMAPQAQAGPVLDAMKKKAHSARGIAVEGSVILKHKLKQKAKQAGGIAREGSLIVKCKARDALKLKKCYRGAFGSKRAAGLASIDPLHHARRSTSTGKPSSKSRIANART